MTAKLPKHKVIPTRIPLDTVPVLERYLAARFISYNTLVNQMLHEKLFGDTEASVAKAVTTPPKVPKTPLPPVPDLSTSGEDMYAYYHHPDLSRKASGEFDEWLNSYANRPMMERYDNYLRSIGKPVDDFPPPQTIAEALELTAAASKAPIIPPPDDDIDLDGIIFDEE